MPTIADLANQANSYVAQVQALQADNDLTPIADALDALGAALNPVPAVVAAPFVDEQPEPVIQ